MTPFHKLRFVLWGRLPSMLQTEAAECGLACLAVVAAYFGHDHGMTPLRRRFSLLQRGATLGDLVSIATHIGLAARPLRLEPAELALLATPCILHWDLNHFVVLKRVGCRGIVIHDPALGVRKVTHAALLKHFTGIALELNPVNRLVPAEPAPRVRLRALIGNLIGLKQSLCMLGAMALAIETLAVISPFFMQWVVDEALVSADRDLLLTLMLGLFLLLILKVSVGAMRGAILITISSMLKVSGRANLFAHLIDLPASYFESRHLDEIMSRFGSQETILQAITTDMVEILLDGLMSVITLVVMLLYAPALTALVVCGAGLYALLRIAACGPLRQASMEAIVWGAKRDTHFLETLRGMKTIKLFNAQAQRQTHWLNLLVQTVNRPVITQQLSLMFRTANALLIGTVAVLVLWFGARQMLENSFSIGMLFAFISYKDQFMSRVSELINKALDLYMLRLHAERLADIALCAPETRSTPHAPLATRSPARIELRQLRFRYGAAGPWILDGIDLCIEAGQSVAIVGASGCGKSTLLRVLASLLAPGGRRITHRRRPDRRTWAGPVPGRNRGRHAGRPIVRRLDRRQHQLLCRLPGRTAGHPLRAPGLRDGRHPGHADGLSQPDRGHGHDALGRAKAAHPDRACALPRAWPPVAR